MKNIVFDLGGVLFARDMRSCTQDFIDFFRFVREDPMPPFWVAYDRGTLTMQEVIDELCRVNGCSREKSEHYLQQSIDLQRPVAATERLIADLKVAGYKLYVLSNMSAEFIAFLRTFPVYKFFDGEVVSCEVQTVKPERRIYELLMERYALDPRETLFIDDRSANIATAETVGIRGFLFDFQDPETACRKLRKELL